MADGKVKVDVNRIDDNFRVFPTERAGGVPTEGVTFRQWAATLILAGCDMHRFVEGGRDIPTAVKASVAAADQLIAGLNAKKP